MGKIGLIIQREYLTRVKKKSFIIMTLVAPLLMAGVFVGAIYLSLSESGSHKVLVVDKTPGMVLNLQLKDSDNVSFFYDNKDLSDEGFQESEYDLMLYLNERTVETNSGALYYKKLPSFRTLGYIKGQLENALESYKLDLNDIDRDAYAHVNTKFTLTPLDINSDSEYTYQRELAGVGFFFAFLIYIFIFLYGVQVMRGVIEEKTNRIVEVIVSSVKPFQLMMGKIVGIALVGITQFALWVVFTTALVSIASGTILKDRFAPETLVENQLSAEVAQGELQQELEQGMLNADDTTYILDLIDRINFPLMIGMFLFYFIGGYMLYAALFAAVGAAVDNETDTQQFMMPITIPLIFGLIVGEFALTNPEGPAAFWFSLVPFTSPIVMMLRVAMGFDAGNIWQLFLSMGLLIAAFVGAVWIAGRIYRTGILMYGKKPTYKELWKWLKYKE